MAQLFTEVASTDVLNFSFGGKSYEQQLAEQSRKSQKFCAVAAEVKDLHTPQGSFQVMWLQHSFDFMGGSLGCAEGEVLTRGFEHAIEHRMPVVVATRTGGARMQEGLLSLMQMAKVSVAVTRLRAAKLPFVSVLLDPTYGGVPASYAMQADVRVGYAGARVGFAGPGVILNTMYEMKQDQYDLECPRGFQSAEYVHAHGQLDMVVEAEEGQDAQAAVEARVAEILSVLHDTGLPAPAAAAAAAAADQAAGDEQQAAAEPDYTRSRAMDRPQSQDIIATCFDQYVRLDGDGKVARDNCLQGGVARIGDFRCVVLFMAKGHNPADMGATNFGMPKPEGYRTALRLMDLAERFGLPVVTLIDCPGAQPDFASERDGQSEAIATNLTRMAELTVPIVTLVVGEGGSGGALGIAMGNVVGMLDAAWYNVISPEGAASILGRYADDAAKARQFPEDCRALATAQHIYAHQLQALGVIDEIIAEQPGETHAAFPVLAARIRAFVTGHLTALSALAPAALVQQRGDKFRAMGRYAELSEEDKQARLTAGEAPAPRRRRAGDSGPPSKLLGFVADTTLAGATSKFRGTAPEPALSQVGALEPSRPPTAGLENAKAVLDRDGPEALAAWVRAQTRCLVTDTTLRDAHQSLIATRLRSVDMLGAAGEMASALEEAFSFEAWGGATFDVAYRFLHESPWQRLRDLRAAMPNVCLQMLLRGSNAVGYKSYSDDLVEKFVALAASNGIDVFRIFDCFNDIEQMRVAINAVRAAGKLAEVCVCFSGDFLDPEETIYTLDYFKEVTRKVVDAGAHMVAIKDMAGLLKPCQAAPFMHALREVTDLPIHFHTHCTSGASLASAVQMMKAGCDVVDFASAAWSDMTSQPSLNAFVASAAGDEHDPRIDYRQLERLDMHWQRVRQMYAPFETGMRSGTAAVWEHEIPGGQYANLLVQAASMGLRDRWGEIVHMYAAVNRVFGNIIKVTPSSKCVGDMALYLVTRNLSAEELVSRGSEMEWPDSVLDLFYGRLGFPHRGLPAELSAVILKGDQPLSERPGASMPAEDWEAERAKLRDEHGLAEPSDEDVISSILYPKVFADYLKHNEENSTGVAALPTTTFFYGMAVGDSITVHASQAEATDLLGEPADAACDVEITLVRVGPTNMAGDRKVEFLVNGRPRHIVAPDGQGEVVISGPMADPDNEEELPSPMPGKVEAVYLQAGAAVAAGDKIATVGAMKMEVHVVAPFDGVLASVAVEVGDNVGDGSLIGVVNRA